MESLKEKNKVLLYIAVIVAALILIIGGVTLFLNFTDGGKVKNDVNVNYQDGKNISVEKVKDDYVYNKKIVVENNTNKEKTYSLRWENVSNNFNVQSDLLYSISGEGEGASELGTSQIPVADSPIFTAVKIGKGKTHTYVVKVWYDKSNKNTNEDNSKFTGDVKVVYEDEK